MNTSLKLFCCFRRRNVYALIFEQSDHSIKELAYLYQEALRKIKGQILPSLELILIAMNAMLFYEEDVYLRALMKYSDLPIKTWLFQYFELYKSTMNWPLGLPPINRCNLIPGTLRTKFNSFYRQKLDEFEHDFDNENQTLKFF